MGEEKRSAPYTLRVLMSEKELRQLDRVCELDGNATRSDVVRRAIQHYGLYVNKTYAKLVAAQRQAERASNLAGITPLEEARARIEATASKQGQA